eukprot:COSAG02_NODE_48_length_45421_cov_103.222100_7_plen_101_part_00
MIGVGRASTSLALLHRTSVGTCSTATVRGSSCHLRHSSFRPCTGILGRQLLIARSRRSLRGAGGRAPRGAGPRARARQIKVTNRFYDKMECGISLLSPGF